MDSDRFDALTRSLSTRRSALGGLLGGVAALLGLALPEEAEAHNFLARCRRIKNKRQRAACVRRARAHNRKHRRAGPPACIPNCTDKACGSDGCGGSCGTCPAGTCSAGQCVCPAGQWGCRGTLCCPNGQACAGSETCGACPANSPALCNETGVYGCGVPYEGNFCACVTSVQGGPTTCSTVAGRCANCTTDAQCSAELGVPGVCVNMSPCSCDMTGGRACLPAGCVNWCLLDEDCGDQLTCVGASGSTPGTCQ